MNRRSSKTNVAVSSPYDELDRPLAPKEPPKKLDLARLLSQAKPERCMLIVATVFLFLSTIVNLAAPGFVGAIIDAIATSPQTPLSAQSQFTRGIKALGFRSNKALLGAAIVGLAINMILVAVFTLCRSYLFEKAGERVVARLRSQLFNAIIGFEIGFFDVTRTGELVNRLSADTTILKEATTVNISMGLRWASTVIGGLVYLFFISWRLTLVMIAVVPIVVISARLYGQKIRNLSRSSQDALARATEVAEESFTHIRTVRSFSREEFQKKFYADRIQDTYKLGVMKAWWTGLFVAGVGLVAGGAIVVVLWYGATLVIDGSMSAGVLTSFVLYTLTVATALGGLSGLFGSLLQAIGANERVFELLDRVAAIPIAGGERPATFHGHIKFNNVTFAYPSRSDVPVLKDFSLDLRPGTVTALVGPSGGGKTTVVKLIERFYDVTSGTITVDGVNLRTLDPSWLHENIGLVDQEPVLFATTIKQNLLYGAENATDEDISKATRMANAEDFILQFPEKYETIVGERGVRLSGGQKQRVAIARAVLKNPKVLIADEATSSLDAESEHRVQEALDRLMQGRTVVVVAHRLSTVKNADNVVVVEQGRLVEQGTHEELLRLNGVYAKLVARQLTAPEEAPRAPSPAAEENQVLVP